MECITTVSYRVLINGGTTKNFVPNKCLRKSDPLSPDIFISCTNVLLALLNQEANSRQQN